MGKVMLKREPWPKALCASILPPCRSTIQRAIARPRPEPPGSRERGMIRGNSHRTCGEFTGDLDSLARRQNAGFLGNPLELGDEINVAEMKISGTGVGAGQGEQIFDEMSGLFGGRQDARKGFAIFVFGARTAQRQLGTAANERDGRAQVVGSVGGELGEPLYGSLEAAEHGVQGFGEAAQ